MLPNYSPSIAIQRRVMNESPLDQPGGVFEDDSAVQQDTTTLAQILDHIPVDGRVIVAAAVGECASNSQVHVGVRLPGSAPGAMPISADRSSHPDRSTWRLTARVRSGSVTRVDGPWLTGQVSPSTRAPSSVTEIPV